MAEEFLRHLKTVLDQSLLEAKLLIRLSLDEQLLWRKHLVEDALGLLRLKKEAMKSFNALDRKRRRLQKRSEECLDDGSSLAVDCQRKLDALRCCSAYLHLISRNTIMLAGRALNGQRRQH